MVKINLFGPVLGRKIDWYDDDAYICPTNVSAALAGKGDVEIHINSMGGDVFAGITIYNLLKNHSGNVNVYVDGLAASAASIIAQAGDIVKMGDGAMMMIHNAWTWAEGNAKELRKVADDLDKIGTSIQDIYMNRFVGDRDELVKLLDEETYLTAEDCITFGFADADIKSDDEAGTQAKDKTEIKASLLEKYRARADAKKTDLEQNTNQSFFMNKFRKGNSNDEE